MVNKLWYKSEEGEDLDYLVREREYIQRIINLYCSELFKLPEDITPDNLKEFLEIVLKNYKYYNLSISDLLDIGDALSRYFHNAYSDEFPDTLYPSYPDNDRRSLAIFIFDEFMAYPSYDILPEEVCFLLECLNTPEDKIVYMKRKVEEYFNQFDIIRRANAEIPKRWRIISEQRLEAIEKNQPLPIQPMGIELSLCYKKGLEPKE